MSPIVEGQSVFQRWRERYFIVGGSTLGHRRNIEVNYNWHGRGGVKGPDPSSSHLFWKFPQGSATSPSLSGLLGISLKEEAAFPLLSKRKFQRPSWAGCDLHNQLKPPLTSAGKWEGKEQGASNVSRSWTQEAVTQVWWLTSPHRHLDLSKLISNCFFQELSRFFSY